jgi:serine/threonine protein kinase
VKTSLDPKFTELIRRKAGILKRLKHPPAEFPLHGANRIARNVAGIALAMPFVHARGFIHRDLRPEKILLDCDWSVRIADFGPSISLNNPAIPAMPHLNTKAGVPFIDSHSFAPELMDDQCSQRSDILAFGTVLFELLTGKRAFSRDLPLRNVAFMIGFGQRPVNLSQSGGRKTPEVGRRLMKSWIDSRKSRSGSGRVWTYRKSRGLSTKLRNGRRRIPRFDLWGK